MTSVLPRLATILIVAPLVSACGKTQAPALTEGTAQNEGRIEEAARTLGEDPKAAVALETANREFYENRPTEPLFAGVIAASKNPNAATRSEAFTTFAPLRGTKFHGRGLAEIERMKTDPSPEIRDRYAWVSWLAQSPRWREICASAAGSDRPEAARLAKKALGMGERPPKRESYIPTPPKP